MRHDSQTDLRVSYRPVLRQLVLQGTYPFPLPHKLYSWDFSTFCALKSNLPVSTSPCVDLLLVQSVWTGSFSSFLKVQIHGW